MRINEEFSTRSWDFLHRKSRVKLAAILLAGGLSGCSSLYLHSDATQQATAKAQADLEKLDVSTVFDNEATYLNELHDRQYDAVGKLYAAQRDADLLKCLYGSSDSSGLNGLALIRQRVDGYLKAIVGKVDARPGGPKLWRMVDAAYDAPGTLLLSKALQDQFVPKATNLPDSPDIPPLPSPSGLSVKSALDAVTNDEGQLAKRKENARKANDDLKTELAKAAALGNPNGAEEAFKKASAHVNKLLTDADPYIRKYVAESLADSLKKVIDATAPEDGSSSTTPEVKAALGFVQATLRVGDVFSNPPKIPHPNALAATQAWLRYVAGDADFQLSQEQALAALHEAEVAAVAAQVFYLSQAGEALAELPAIKLSFNEGMAKVLADRTHSRAAIAALQYYADAWTKGFIPALQLREVEEPLAIRHAKLQRSRQAADAWSGTLKPGVATLAAYGAGGLDPHAVAQLLQAVGLGAIAVGVNK